MKSTRSCLYAVLLAVSAAASPSVAGVTHYSKSVGYIHSATQSGQCMWFSLVGVTEADPQVPNNQWFTIPLTHATAKEVLMILTVAKLSDRTVTVVTSNSTACGYAAVEYVYMG